MELTQPKMQNGDEFFLSEKVLERGNGFGVDRHVFLFSGKIMTK